MNLIVSISLKLLQKYYENHLEEYVKGLSKITFFYIS